MYYPTVHMHILLHLIYPPFTSMAYGYIKYSITTNPNVHEVFGILAPRFKTPTSVDDEFSVKPSTSRSQFFCDVSTRKSNPSRFVFLFPKNSSQTLGSIPRSFPKGRVCFVSQTPRWRPYWAFLYQGGGC